MTTAMLTHVALLAQGGGAYNAGRITGMVFMAVLAGAILWRLLKKK